MRVPVSWLREYVHAPADPAVLDAAFVKVGLEVEEITDLRGTVTGDLVVGRVLEIEELTGFKKPIRFCRVDVGKANRSGEPQEVICGATNFAAGDTVVVILPGSVLPGGFAVGSRRTYGRDSHGMIVSGRELGISDDHTGIIVLPPETSAAPGDDARGLVGLDDIVVELNITPDRGYCFSVRGIARELASSLGLPFRDPAAQVPVPGVTAEPAYPVKVEDPVGCDRFYGRVVRGTDPTAPSPAWMKRRLTQAGMRPISLAVDVTNYLMLELGQPMHAFDLAKLQGGLIVRRAAAGERLTTLDGAERRLDPDDLVIVDDSGVISLAAIMGGASTEISEATTDLLFEAAHWDPMSVARAARRHKLPSEASRRFERGVDPALPPVAIARAVALLTEYGGGTVEDRVLDVNTVAPREPIRIAADLPARTAGVPYPAERVVALLEEVGCTVAVDDEHLDVTPPTWRPDLTDPADLAEEVVRLDGYDKVPSVLPIAPPGNGLTATQIRRRTVARALAEAGYVETLCYPFISESALDALGLPPNDPRRQTVRLVNPLSEEEPALRTTLLPPLLATLRRNLGRGHRDVALYELGLVFHPRPGSADESVPPRLGVADRPADDELAAAEAFVPDQPWHVAVVITGDAEPAGWWGGGRPASWADAVEAARVAIAAAGVPAERVAVRAGERAPWHPGRCAEILVDGAVVGYAGELHPAVVAALELPKRTSAMEFTLDALPLPGVIPAPRISAYPPALIDVALVVDADVPAAAVEAALVAGAGELLESVRLFDVYANAGQLGEGRKSLAYNLVFRAPDRTLTVEDAVAARDAAVAEAAARFGAVLRGA
ncbi:MAG TPA: phenylalanine--tRNA ligase subunit beta [Pilimelia sp.]|nr:phenylalanine--tRNA ligase subunit beta [Pilimelia sp.]